MHSGSFGIGWTCSWDMHLVIASNGDTTFVDGEDRRLYQPNYFNGYQSVAKDGSVLKKLKDGRFQLTESDGTVRFFDANGLLSSLVDTDGNKIVFSYENGRLTGLAAGSEIRTITRNAAGQITSITDQNGFVRSYSYNDENQLISVSDSDNMATYIYGDDPLKSLASINGENGAVFSYDANGRFNSIARNGHTCDYDYGTTGKVSVSRDGTVIGTTYYGLNGAPVKTISADNLTIGNIVTGYLTDENGMALAGITVDAIADKKIYSTVTDANGAYMIAGLPESIINLCIQDEAYLSLDECFAVDGILIADQTLTPAENSVSGTYTYADTAETATIVLTNKTTGDYSVVRGKSGRFAAYDLAVGEYDFEISAGDSATYHGSFAIAEDSGYQTLGSFDLRVGGNVEYTVDSPAAQKNIVVQLVDKNGIVVAEEICCRNGTYSFDNVAEGTYSLKAVSTLGDTIASSEITVESLKTAETTLLIRSGVALSGIISDANDNAQQGICLLLSNGERTQFVISDTEGNYRFDDLAGGEYTLSIPGMNAPINVFTISDGQEDITYCVHTDYVASWSGTLFDVDGNVATGTVSLYLDGECIDSVYAAEGYFRFDLKKAGSYSIVAENETGFFSQVKAADIVAGSEWNSEFTLGTYVLTVDTSFVSADETCYVLSHLDDDGNVISSNWSDSAEFGGLVAGKYKLEAYNGNCKAEKTFEVSGNCTQKIAFERLNELKLSINDVESLFSVLLYDSNNVIVDSIYVDAPGTYSFQALESANYKLVTLYDGDYSVKNIAVGADTEIIIEKPANGTGTLSGTVLVDGQIGSGVGVFLHNREGG